ncbi:glycosyltransferase family 2 protein [Mycoplasmoides pneumoniae]|uniref:glycosyltransferase family 2 protein n=1 Tax=Mycoplasmoides pneumoniae TaxID=2104 RepID=UPI001375F9A6|nr:glycosyltransferase family 2 protein [Mycoplasmoides pneumoniae]QHR05044.1 glycosyltransferase family 2 protein [Mycoplasmoides pneumoniae]QHR09254.1 glycosyltransferase family 2 protein [Mycoplasmoides pneumoniae]
MKISVIISTYNCGALIVKALCSLVSNQTPACELEVLVIDDGSIDNTRQIIKKFQAKVSFTLKYFYKKNGNWGSVINYVKENRLANGDWITVLDSDDTLKPNTLNKLANLVEKADYDLVVFDYTKCWKKIKLKIHTYPTWWKNMTRELQKQTPFCIPLGKFLKRNLFYKLPKLKEKVSFQDALYTASSLKLAKKVRHVNQSGGNYHFKRAGNSMSIPWNIKRFSAELDICKDLIRLNAQEIALVHLLRQQFRVQFKEKQIQLAVTRDFNFSGFSWYTRCFLWMVYQTMLKRYFYLQTTKQ